MKSFLSPIPEIIKELSKGKMVVIVDDENRENEGDLIFCGSSVSSEKINFMAKYARGLICLALDKKKFKKLKLKLMTDSNQSKHRTAFTVSIEAKKGVTTGISAKDRSRTIKTAIKDKVKKEEIVSPGHIFPIISKDGGVLVRAGHTEAAVDIARLANLNGSGVICEIMNDDGTMARLPDLINFAQKHKLKVGTISDLIAYRRKHDNLIRETVCRKVKSEFGGEWTLRIFHDEIDGGEHITLTKGKIQDSKPVLVRMHTANPMDDMLGLTPGKSNQLSDSMKKISETGRGVIVLLKDMNIKLDLASDPPHILRKYGIGAQILLALGVHEIILLSNSKVPKIIGLDGYGLKILNTIKIN